MSPPSILISVSCSAPSGAESPRQGEIPFVTNSLICAKGVFRSQSPRALSYLTEKCFHLNLLFVHQNNSFRFPFIANCFPAAKHLPPNVCHPAQKTLKVNASPQNIAVYQVNGSASPSGIFSKSSKIDFQSELFSPYADPDFCESPLDSANSSSSATTSTVYTRCPSLFS